uniref:Uncharacterized protein n=1 Tax=Haemonchus contortus TaxID=6289 RepID=W6NF90_HAECO
MGQPTTRSQSTPMNSWAGGPFFGIVPECHVQKKIAKVSYLLMGQAVQVAELYCGVRQNQPANESFCVRRSALTRVSN